MAKIFIISSWNEVFGLMLVGKRTKKVIMNILKKFLNPIPKYLCSLIYCFINIFYSIVISSYFSIIMIENCKKQSIMNMVLMLKDYRSIKYYKLAVKKTLTQGKRLFIAFFSY